MLYLASAKILRQKELHMRSMLQAGIFFILLTAHLIISVPANATQTFEQAYAPIDVSGITIFIPIELIPEPATYLTIKNTGNQSLLEWEPLANVTRYILEQEINGNWVVLNNNLLTNSYATSINNNLKFRVSSCHKYGCSVSQAITDQINVDIQIRSFLASDYKVNGGDTIDLDWDVIGASTINLSSNKGHNYQNLAPKGSTKISTNDLTTFTLTASGFGTQVSQKLSIIKPVAKPQVIAPQSSIYLQPLYDLNLEPIERSLLVGKNNNNYVADLQRQLHRVSDTGQIIWTRNLTGLIANQPVYLIDANGDAFLFFALSKSNLIDTNIAGQFCRLKVDNQHMSCFNLANNAIAGPVVNMEDDVNPQLYLIDVSGFLYEFSAFESENLELIASQQLLHNQSSIRVLTTPQLNIDNQQLIVRTENNDFLAYPLPTAESFMSQTINAVSNILSSDTSQVDQEQTQTQTNPVWSRKLD